MEITVTQALALAPKVWNILVKLFGIIKSGVPGTIDEEIAALEAARLRPSDEIISEADKA